MRSVVFKTSRKTRRDQYISVHLHDLQHEVDWNHRKKEVVALFFKINVYSLD